MQFANPQLAWLLVLLPIFLAVGAVSNRLKQRRLALFIDSMLYQELITNFKSISLQTKLRSLWTLLVTSCLVVACLGPQWGYTWRPTTKRGVDIVVAVDVSESMMVEDVKPNRLGRAHRKILDLIAEFRGDRVGLVAFAGVAFTETPLTLDYGALRSYVTSLNPSLIPIKGTNIEHAIRESIRTLEKGSTTSEDNSSNRSRAIILITDGEEFDGDLSKVAKLAEEKKIALYIMGVGTVEGGPIPSPKGYKKDKQGKIVISKLRPDVLQDLATQTKGIFVQSIGTDEDTKAIYNSGIRESLASSEVSGQRSKIWHEYFQLPLLFALVFIVIGPWGTLFGILQKQKSPLSKQQEHLRSLIVLSMFFAYFSPHLLLAESLEARGSTGAKLFQSGKFDEALKVFREASSESQGDARFLLGEGASAYRLGDYATALRAFSSAIDLAQDTSLKSQVLFNTGNSQVQLGDYKAAIESYEKSLKLNSKDNEALENLAYAKKLLEQQKENKNQEQNPEDQSNPDKSKSDQDKSENNQSSKDEKDNNQSQSNSQSKTEDEENKQDENQGSNDKPQESKEDSKEEDPRQNDSQKEQDQPSGEDAQSENQNQGQKDSQDANSHERQHEENQPDGENNSNESNLANDDYKQEGETNQTPQLSQESQMKLDSIEERRNARYNYRFNKAIQQLKQEQRNPPEKDW